MGVGRSVGRSVGLLGHLIPVGLKEIRRKHERGKREGRRKKGLSEREEEKEKEIEKAGILRERQ